MPPYYMRGHHVAAPVPMTGRQATPICATATAGPEPAPSRTGARGRRQTPLGHNVLPVGLSRHPEGVAALCSLSPRARANGAAPGRLGRWIERPEC